MKQEKRFLTTGEVAEYCTVSHLTVTNWIRAGKLLASRTPGGHSRIRREDLLRFLIEYNFPVPQELIRGGKRVLVVDDDRPLAETMAQSLQEDGYQVDVAFDGYEAGLKMATLKPDLLVLDLIMPGIDGFAICRRVKMHPETRGTKVLAVTGFVQEGNLATALECGADLCLEKPVRLETLKETVAKLLGENRSTRTTDLGSERRRSLRVPADFPVMCLPTALGATIAADPWPGRTLNISRDGALLAVDAPLQPFSIVMLQIFLREGHEPIHVVAESRWMKESRGGKTHFAGVAFAAIQPRDRERLAQEIYASWGAPLPAHGESNVEHRAT